MNVKILSAVIILFFMILSRLEQVTVFMSRLANANLLYIVIDMVSDHINWNMYTHMYN